MAQKLISMTEKELIRSDVIKSLTAGSINGTEAAKQLDISVRQTKRLKSAFLESGVGGLIHGNRGRSSNRKIDDKIINEAINILKKHYSDFGPTFAGEKLKEEHNVILGRETLRQIMIKEKLWRPKPRRQSKIKHLWRPRKDNFGEMQQFDGSYHYWLESRGSELCLLLSVDDATGEITHARFDLNEGVMAVFNFWLEYFQKNGMPISVYLDKFSTYKVNHKNAVDNAELMTQFQRAAGQVGVKLITANSPEAKGRIERMFRTLQDRLVKEMRLAGISSIEDANKFLQSFIPKFNAKFSVVPRRKANLHKTVGKRLQVKLPQIFSRQSQRKVQNDYTIMFEKKYYQLDRQQPTTVYKKDSVIVEEHLSGSLKINLKGHYLKYIELPQRPKKQIDIKLPALTRKKQFDWKPPADHPWRKQFLFNQKLKTKNTVAINSNN